MATPVLLPGTPFLVLDEDSNHAVLARERGTIKTEDTLFGLREVLALPPGSVVFDVGAYVGDTARFFLDAGHHVHAFEPFPDAFQCLTHNCPEATCVKAAVGDGSSVALDFRCDATYEHHAANFGTRGVRAVKGGAASLRLDDYADPLLMRLDLLKIDVEGFEPAVMAGATEIIRRFRPIILVEIFDSMLARLGWSRWDVIRQLPSGYRRRVCVGSDADDRRDYVAWPEEKWPEW